MSQTPIALTFRQEILTPLVGKLQDGFSCALVGVGSSGKSNIVRHLKRQDVRQHYFGGRATRVLYLFIDLDSLHTYSAQAVYTKLFQTLMDQVGQLGSQVQTFQGALEKQWREMLVTPSEVFAQWCLGQAVKKILEQYADLVIFVFDDCDKLIQEADAAVLGALRALRNDHKDQLVYVTVSRKELSQLRGATPEFETFFELFALHILFVGPYREVDALEMIERLASKTHEAVRPLAQAEIRRLLQLSGNHAGLISTVYQATNRARDSLAIDIMQRNIIELLYDRKPIRAECQKIWDSLPEPERTALQNVVTGKPTQNSAVQVLIRKGLVQENVDGTRSVFSPLMREFVHYGGERYPGTVDTPSPAGASASGGVRNNAPDSAASTFTGADSGGGSPQAPLVSLDHGTHVVTIGTTPLKMELPVFELFIALWHKMPDTCTKAELAYVLLSFKFGDDPYARLDAYLATLVRQLQPTPLRLLKSADEQYRLSDQ